MLQEALSVEKCEVVCTRVCQTVCSTRHLSVHSIVGELNDWTYDSAVDNNPREFIENGTVFQERRPAQYLRGTSGDTLGQEVEPLNLTCTLPTVDAVAHELIMGNSFANLTGQQGIFDMFGRRFHAQNVFDLTLYVQANAIPRPVFASHGCAGMIMC